MLSAEQAYRDYLAEQPDCLTTTLDSVLPPDANNDDAATRLVRLACFGRLHLDDTEFPTFAEEVPEMVTHGIRQVMLLDNMLENDQIRDGLSTHINPHTLRLSLMAADFALSAVGKQEVHDVHTLGPAAAVRYSMHSALGYDIAGELVQEHGLDNPESRFVKAYIARHHKVQAKNAYGLDWDEIDDRFIDQFAVDWSVLCTKPIDYIDDTLSQAPRNDAMATLTGHVTIPTQRFTSSYSSLICAELGLSSQMAAHDRPFGLPNEIARRTRQVILDPQYANGIGVVYQQLHTELVS